MATRLARRWPASLHGGQVAIIVLGLSLLGYGLMSAAALIIWNVGNRAFGSAAPAAAWAAFLGGVIVVLTAHLLARAWASSRSLAAIISLVIALWLPSVLGLWAYRSSSEAQRESVEDQSREPWPALDTMPPGRQAFSRAYVSVAGEYAALLLGSGVLAIVLLFRWFGERRLGMPLDTSGARAATAHPQRDSDDVPSDP